MPSSLSLPSELKHHIAQLSSRNSLASLARTHTAYQTVAEQALYRTLSILPSDNDSLKCMETLAMNPEKAAFVHFLAMVWARHEADKNRRAMTYLIKSLINMHSLSDFRLRMRGDKVNAWIEDLDKILCESHFGLRTLYCDGELDLSRIIKSQTELQLLGIYGSCYKESFLKSLNLNQLHLPVVFTLERDCTNSIFSNVGIFPAFYSIDRQATIHQVLAESFGKDQDRDTRADVDGVSELSIYVVDSSDMPSIHVLAKNMAVCFPQIGCLDFYFERRCEIPSQEMKKIVSLFPELNQLSFNLWPGHTENAGPKIPEDIKIAYVKELEVACPELISLSFIDAPWLLKATPSDEWILLGV